jgi:hypothetical protein
MHAGAFRHHRALRVNPSVTSENRSQVDWRAVTSDIARSPEPVVEPYPLWCRALLFVGLGVGAWAMIIGLIAFVGAVS